MQALTSQGHTSENQTKCQSWENWVDPVLDVFLKDMTKQERNMWVKDVCKGVTVMIGYLTEVRRGSEWESQGGWRINYSSQQIGESELGDKRRGPGEQDAWKGDCGRIGTAVTSNDISNGNYRVTLEECGWSRCRTRALEGREGSVLKDLLCGHWNWQTVW